ncbi:porin family protein [Pyxidicoccus xibeiensis]|uniref:porin family protein n=1 Tax=Pyxidicoccus xibeiensis TaxID=2906759 RepID=UPI0020A6EE2E|nr:porin family protein [Pyxidicoccus xibeiensis]MCP3139976.1 porin family protein [Pyxidicoccus xibeiensis]
MRTLSKWVALAGVLGLGTEAAAEGWQGYASLGAGITLDHLSDFRSMGPALHGYLGVESPPGLSLGLLAEVSETWGKQQFPTAADPNRLEKPQLDYKAVGIEARLRFFRDKPINPWVGARLSKSWSSTFTPNEVGNLFREKIDTTSMAFRVGVDGWLSSRWGVSVSTAFQFCDVKFTTDVIKECAEPLHSVIAGPVIRF